MLRAWTFFLRRMDQNEQLKWVHVAGRKEALEFAVLRYKSCFSPFPLQSYLLRSFCLLVDPSSTDMSSKMNCIQVHYEVSLWWYCKWTIKQQIYDPKFQNLQKLLLLGSCPSTEEPSHGILVAMSYPLSASLAAHHVAAGCREPAHVWNPCPESDGKMGNPIILYRSVSEHCWAYG